jgi:hypothetical protein
MAGLQLIVYQPEVLRASRDDIYVTHDESI